MYFTASGFDDIFEPFSEHNLSSFFLPQMRNNVISMIRNYTSIMSDIREKFRQTTEGSRYGQRRVEKHRVIEPIVKKKPVPGYEEYNLLRRRCSRRSLRICVLWADRKILCSRCTTRVRGLGLFVRRWLSSHDRTDGRS